MEGGAHSLSSQNLIPQPHLMNSIFPSSTTRLLSNPSKIRVLSKLFSIESCRKRDSVSVKVRDAELKENWLASLSCSEELRNVNGSGLKWMIGVDPDLSGALALLKFQGDSVCSAQVFDTPYLQVLVGKGVRRRHDAKSISQLLRSFDAPFGTTAYLEQSTPFPQDGKQGWWGGGFGYGLWIGALVASGFSVVPVSSRLWKKHFELFGSCSSKDDSRKVASTLFPLLSSQLTRKKDHGRAEALLIAAYGKGLTIKSEVLLHNAA